MQKIWSTKSENQSLIRSRYNAKLKVIRTSFLLRVAILMFIGFGVKLFFSCVPPPPIDLNYNIAYATGVDNSDRYMQLYENVDTMYADAVAINLTLGDTAYHYPEIVFNQVFKSFTFSPALALSFDERFIPVNKVVHIGVTTLLDMGGSIKAGDDISEFILYATGSDSGLYSKMDEAVSVFNRTQSSSSNSIILVLSKSVESTSAQFRVVISLDDGSQLSCETDTFTIISAK